MADLSLAQAALSVLSGSAVGFALGLIGGGGSILAVPLLLYVVGLPSLHLAIGTSALAVAANAFANLAQHARTGTVRWPCAAVFATSGVIGALAGSSAVKRHQEPSRGRHREPSHPGHADAPAGAGAVLGLSSPERRFSRRR